MWVAGGGGGGVSSSGGGGGVVSSMSVSLLISGDVGGTKFGNKADKSNGKQMAKQLCSVDSYRLILCQNASCWAIYEPACAASLVEKSPCNGLPRLAERGPNRKIDPT